MKDNLLVSAIIPVLNNYKCLEICLRALERQTYPKSLYEIIVVDNGSVENIETLVNQFAQASFTDEAQPGSYAARNKGISIASGEVIAFTDSDCIPTPTWLEAGVRHLLSVPKCGLVAGKINIFFKNPDQPTAVEVYDSISYLNQREYVEKYKYGTTANLFTFKSVFEDVGVFNSKLKSGGDREWGKRVFSLGYSLIYADDACVAHPARHSLAQLYKKIARVRGGYYDLDRLDRNENPKYSLRQLIRDLSGFKPQLRSTFLKVWSDQGLKSNKQRAQVFLVSLFVHYAKSWEKIRLQLGGKSKR
jgi:glycosyltransferase involved in cell wall biosynthesis